MDAETTTTTKAEKVSPAYSTKFLDAMMDKGFETLKAHLEATGAKPEAVSLANALHTLALEMVFQAEGWEASCSRDDFVSTALGDLSRAVPALGGDFGPA